MNCINKQKGFSLMEILIVIVVIGIVVTIAVMTAGNSKSQIQTQNVARELKVYLERARFDSIKRRPENESDMAKVVINDATSFMVHTDRNNNGVLEEIEKQNVKFINPFGVSLNGNNLVYPITMIFDRRGYVSARNGVGTLIPAYFLICRVECNVNTTGGEGDTYTVGVSSTGTVIMMNGIQILETINDPSVTLLGEQDGIDTWLARLPKSEGGSATPTPTPIPTVTPPSNTNSNTNTNTNSNTNSNTNTNTSTNSNTTTNTNTNTTSNTTTNSNTNSNSNTNTSAPTCARNERPAQTGCICKAPLALRPNGKCQ